uniref:aspartate--tRNA ligase n=1 Tax=Rhizochromulina marina TaxID=1034831 RepID=A0A7S2RWB9_9STRA
MAALAEDIVAKITAAGDEIREMKKAGATKDEIMAKVAVLNGLKDEYEQATGKKYANPAAQGSKKDKKKGGGGASGGENSKNAKKEARIKAKEEAQAKAAAEREAKLKAKEAENDDATKYGDSPLVQSAFITDRVWVDLPDLNEGLAGSERYIRARVHTSRKQGKGCFLLLRQGFDTVQGVLFQGKGVSAAMVAYAAAISKESVVDIRASIATPPEPIASATKSMVELHILEIHAISRSAPLPFDLEDASRADGAEGVTVNQDTRLNYRWVDTRTPANQAIFRIQSGISNLFREFMYSRGFTEIHTPKILGGASEGGSEVFTLSYMGRPACLAQSPQLYKQMCAACGGFERVFEVGPVFRAENSNTHRHLCEFTGLDFEMAFHEHYYEVLQVFSDLFIFIFDQLNIRYKNELEAIRAQHPFEDLKFCRPSLRLTFAEGIKLLQDAGYTEADPDEDLTTELEKALGRIVKEKFDTDFFMMDKYPLKIRPFYTMPDPENPKLSNSYDLFIRGEEIVSGAQRIHDVELLKERAAWWEIPEAGIQSYLDAFKFGALPHGGGGIGLERVAMLFLGLKNIRKASMFPRDPQRLAP